MIHVGYCVCAKHPDDILIKKNEQVIRLRLRNCEIRKRVVERIR